MNPEIMKGSGCMLFEAKKNSGILCIGDEKRATTNLMRDGPVSEQGIEHVTRIRSCSAV
jgi:hypothetical protein